MEERNTENGFVIVESTENIPSEKEREEYEKCIAIYDARYDVYASSWFWNWLWSTENQETTSEIQSLHQQLEENRAALKDLTDKLRSKESDIAILQKEKSELEQDKKDALTRISKLVSVKLRDSNPNIADLDDKYKPTKLAEMFSELYDNEWTDAYTVLTESLLEEDICLAFLLDIVKDSYKYCKDAIDNSWTFITQWFIPQDGPNCQELSKALKDGLKAKTDTLHDELLKDINKMQKPLIERHKRIPKEMLEKPELQTYIKSCLKVSLKMAATDPPIIMSCPRIQKNKESSEGCSEVKFDKEMFKSYTVIGPLIDFFVWPALLLHENGPLLGKGVAQCKKDKTVLLDKS